jgi:predicted amidophosphoribosyltransferase
MPARSLVAAARDLLLGEVCAGCGDEAALLCERCAASLVARPRRVHPLGAPHGLPATTAAAGYDGVLRRVIVAYKEQGRRALADPLAGLLAASVLAATGGRPELVVPIPSRRSTTRSRGHDAMVGIVRCMQARLPGVTVLPVLSHTRRVADQGGLSLAQRRTNLDGALRAAHVRPALRGRTIVLVDDVCSSGATLAAAAGAVVAAGVTDDVVAAVLAAPPQRTGGRGAMARAADRGRGTGPTAVT